MNSLPALCVGITTRNRGHRVVEALESVLVHLGGADELIIVDDGSTDETAVQVARWLERRFPRGRLVTTENAGLSAGRNIILRATTADVVCFFDDDQLAAEDWLSSLRRAWGEAEADVGAIGGRMRPIWGVSRPPWLHDYLLHVVSVLDLGPVRLKLDQTPFTGYAWGGNLSVRVAAAAAVGNFSVTAGARPEAPQDKGDEEEFQDRLAAAGWQVWYEPASAIDHVLLEDRLNPEYFRNAHRRSALKHVAEGKGRSRGLYHVGRSLARSARAIIRRDPTERVLATFERAYGRTLFAASRRTSA